MGGLQWYLELPGELVWLHVALATLTWLTMLWTVATAGRLEPREAMTRPLVDSSSSERPEPALTQS